MAFFDHSRIDEIGELDKLAYQVLAISYSGIYVDEKQVQKFVWKPCVAVAFHNGILLLAANNVWRLEGPGESYSDKEVAANVGNTTIFAMVCQSLRAKGIQERIQFLRNPLGESDTTYHAEQQLIDFVYHAQSGHFDLHTIGVSKPCCQVCANELQNLGVQITDFHSLPTNASHPEDGNVPNVYYEG